MPPRLRQTQPLLLAIALGIAGALVAQAMRMPLPWMLGPMFACGIASMAGLRLAAPPYVREGGQIAIGLAVGLRVTPEVVVGMSALAPAMLGATVYVVLVGVAAALVLAPLARVDRRTAFFATAAAGLAEMAVLARQRGADAHSVAVVHAIRVAGVVAVVPLAVTAFGAPPADATGLGAGAEDLATASPSALAALGLAGLGAALLMRHLKLPNPWLLGPIAAGAIAASVVFGAIAVPGPIVAAAQLLIGIALGCRFRREEVLRLPRVAAAGLGVAALLVVAAAAGAAVLVPLTDLPFAAAFLALAPAGAAEMVVTAKVLGLDPAVVTGFHIVRIAVLNLSVLALLKIFERVTERIYGPAV